MIQHQQQSVTSTIAPLRLRTYGRLTNGAFEAYCDTVIDDGIGNKGIRITWIGNRFD